MNLMNPMSLALLLGLPLNPGVALVRVEDARLWLAVRSRLSFSMCPRCGTASSQRHSAYSTVLDAPCTGRIVSIALQVRKFRCRNDSCPQRIFAEQFLEFVRPWARKTVRSVQAILHLGWALGGRGAEQLASLLHIPTSDQTVLRLLHNAPLLDMPLVAVLGVDGTRGRRVQVVHRSTYGRCASTMSDQSKVRWRCAASGH